MIMNGTKLKIIRSSGEMIMMPGKRKVERNIGKTSKNKTKLETKNTTIGVIRKQLGKEKALMKARSEDIIVK